MFMAANPIINERGPSVYGRFAVLLCRSSNGHHVAFRQVSGFPLELRSNTSSRETILEVLR
jgi:hypothetical protein